ncbi:hypothetical protein EJ02DRAFT_428589 [Clathrospora elynae]|uniref:Uncharacterized protein n=1 Tax=Clathrospora elynae TaxID=706981 RepID=A0A6A5S694_9PLEO|nr:hypothetical protein EJ02DRAFT_428589 [Clathrospora elynae]
MTPLMDSTHLLVLSSAASPTELARLVQAKLPRELRDLVYSFLWDDKVMEKLDYQSHLSRPQPCPSKHCINNNVICLCTQPNTFPVFARPIFVGYPFAYEAIAWLYDNYNGFTLDGSVGVERFMEGDLFHVRLTPASLGLVRLRRLTLRADLGVEGDVPKFRPLQQNLAQLHNFKLRHDFALKLTFYVRPVAVRSGSCMIFSLANALETVEPAVSTLENDHGFKVNVYHAMPYHSALDVKHMLVPLNHGKWKKFMDNELERHIRRFMSQSLRGMPNTQRHIEFERLGFFIGVMRRRLQEEHAREH